MTMCARIIEFLYFGNISHILFLFVVCNFLQFNHGNPNVTQFKMGATPVIIRYSFVLNIVNN